MRRNLRWKRSLQKKWNIFIAGLRIHWRSLSAATRTGKILIIHLDPLGDTALLVAYLRSIGLSADQFDVCSLASLAPFWQHFFPTLQVFPFPTRSWDTAALRQMCRELRSRQYDAVILPCVSPPGAYLASCPMAPHRYGMIEAGRFFSGSRWLLSKVYDALATEHVIDRFRKLFGWINPEWSKPRPLSLPRPTAAPAVNTVLLHPGGKWKPRRWSPERYLQLARLLAMRGFSVHILIHQTEPDLFHFFRSHLTGKTAGIQIIQTTTIADLLEALGNAHFFIGNDSGPAHCAALMDIPTLVLWGPADEARIHPLGARVVILKKDIDCRPCKQYIHPDRCERGVNLCLQWITVEEVLETFLSKLARLSP